MVVQNSKTPFKLKKALWAENDKEIRLELDKKEKVKNIEMTTKNRKKLPSRSHTFGCKIMVQIPLPREIDHLSGKTEYTAGIASRV